MALKRRNKIDASFSMASMTDVIFLLLIFFMVTSTIVFPNAIKVLLPQSKQQTAEKPLTKVTIDKELNYYISSGSESARSVSEEELIARMAETGQQSPETFVALYADESVPYREIVNVLNIANENKLKMVLATRSVKESPQPQNNEE